jgi:hypothetical protein
MWSYAAFDTRGQEWEAYSYNAVSDMSGSGYSGVIRFYRMFWNEADETQRKAIVEGAEYVSKTIDGHVSAVDVIDKVLWSANGDPARLGLRFE